MKLSSTVLKQQRVKVLSLQKKLSRIIPLKKFKTPAIILLACLTTSVSYAKDVSVSIHKEKRFEVVEGQFTVPNNQVAWSVLTDYNNLPKFVSSLVRSKVLARVGNLVTVEQEATGKAFIFEKQMYVRLDIMERPQLAIYFSDSSRMDFLIYEGAWDLEQQANNVKVTYTLRFKPRFNVPSFLGKHTMKKNITKLLGEVRTEIIRRNK